MKKPRIGLLKPAEWTLTAFSAGLLLISFPPFSAGFAAWFGLAPLFCVLLLNNSPRKALNLGYVWGLIFFLGTLHWFYQTVGAFGFILIGILSIFPAIFSSLVTFIRKKHGPATAAVLIPFIWTGIEYFRSELWYLKFAWAGLGYSQHAYTPMIQISDITGIYGISFVIALSNSSIALLIIYLTGIRTEHPAVSRKATLALSAIALLLVAAESIYGGICMNRDYSSGKWITVAGLQSDVITPKELEVTRDELKKASAPVRLIVWPEYSLALFIDESFWMLEGIESVAKDSNAYFLFGGKEKVGKDNYDTKFNNTAFLVSPEGKIAGRAVKMNPIQFFSDGLPGRKFGVLKTDFAVLGVGICYDMDYTYVSRNLAALGAEMLVFPTLDDATWGRVQHLQHAAMSPFRAVENRRYLFRVAASGVSQMVNTHGRIVDSHGIDFRGAFISRGRLNAHKTIYTRYGYLFSWLCLAVAAAVVINSFFGKKT